MTGLPNKKHRYLAAVVIVFALAGFLTTGRVSADFPAGSGKGTCDSAGVGPFMCGWDASTYTGGHNPGPQPDEIQLSTTNETEVYTTETIWLTAKFRSHNSIDKPVYMWLNLNGYGSSYFDNTNPILDFGQRDGLTITGPGGSKNWVDESRCANVFPRTSPYDSVYGAFGIGCSTNGAASTTVDKGAFMVGKINNYNPAQGWATFTVEIKLDPGYNPRDDPKVDLETGHKEICFRSYVSTSNTDWPSGTPALSDFDDYSGSSQRLDDLRAISGQPPSGATPLCMELKDYYNPYGTETLSCSKIEGKFVNLAHPPSNQDYYYAVYVDKVKPSNQISRPGDKLKDDGYYSLPIDGADPRYFGNGSTPRKFIVLVYSVWNGGTDYRNVQKVAKDTKAINCASQVGTNYPYQFQPVGSNFKNGGADRPGDIYFTFNTNLTRGPPAPNNHINNTTIAYTVYQTHANGNPQSTIRTASNTGTVGNEIIAIPVVNTDGITYEAGDQFCMAVSIDPGSGTANSNGDRQVPPGPKASSMPDCVMVKNQPIFKVYGSAVSAGGGFGGSCPAGQSRVLGGWYNNGATSAGTPYGSSSQFVAQSFSQQSLSESITGFASAQGSQPGAPPGGSGSPVGLTFANHFGTVTSTYTAVPDPESPKLGGYFGGCPILADLPRPPGTPTDISPSAAVGTLPLDDGAHSRPLATNLTLNGGTVGLGKNVSAYVDGDVSITGNIIYTPVGWSASIKSIPSFTLWAKGNIYIDPGVTQLDGIYVSKKKIYTCAPGFGVPPSYSAGGGFSLCKNQLTVNGSFVADQINLMRTYGSLRNEPQGLGGCASNGGTSSYPVCAAEVFNFSPEMYLSQPAYNKGPTIYKAITSLPPVL